VRVSPHPIEFPALRLPILRAQPLIHFRDAIESAIIASPVRQLQPLTLAAHAAPYAQHRCRKRHIRRKAISAAPASALPARPSATRTHKRLRERAGINLALALAARPPSTTATIWHPIPSHFTRTKYRLPFPAHDMSFPRASSGNPSSSQNHLHLCTVG
jgi:hypothetical protein